MVTKISEKRARMELVNLIQLVRSPLALHDMASLPEASHLADQICRFVEIIYPGQSIMKGIPNNDIVKARYNPSFRNEMEQKYRIDIADSSQLKEKRSAIVSEHTKLVREVVSQLLPMFPNYLDHDPVNKLGKEYFELLERSENYKIRIKSKGEDLNQREIDEIDRRERAVGPFYLPGYNTIEDLDRIFFRRSEKGMYVGRGLNYIQSLREYWDIFIKELLNIFNYIKEEDILFEPLSSVIGIGIENYWFESYESPNGKRYPVSNISVLYDRLVQMDLIEPERSECFCEVFRNHISLGLPRPIVWYGTTARQHAESTGNATMLYYLISALRNWEMYKKIIHTPELVEVKEILTKKDREGISQFFTGPTGPILADSLKFLTKNRFVGKYIYDLIAGFRAGT